MWKYCLKKLVRMIVVMFLISFLSFAVIYFAPGDISDMYVTADMSEEQKENLIAELGLDKSMVEHGQTKCCMEIWECPCLINQRFGLRFNRDYQPRFY